MSRPDEYTLEVATQLCEQIAQVGSVGKACGAVGIARGTFYKWLGAHPEFVGMYQAAKAEYADSLFEEIETLMNADPPKDADGNIDKAYPNMLRVKLEAIKYRLRCLHPRAYSERVELTGAEGAPLVPESPVMTEAQLLDGARRIAFMLHRAGKMHQEARSRPLLAAPIDPA